MTIAMASAKLGAHWIQCADCDGWFDPYGDPGHTVPDYFDEKTICANCLKRAGLHACDGCGEISDGSYLFDCGGEWFCESCADAGGWIACEHCGTSLAFDDQHPSPDNTVYCRECYYDRHSGCDGCGEWFENTVLTCRDDSAYCCNCVPDDENDENDGYDGNFRPSGFRNRSGCTTKIGSERCYGLELETDDCDGYHELSGSGAWGAKNDPTCNGKEFYSAILDGDEGLKAVADLSKLAGEQAWEIGEDCGYHLHIDMRQENDDSLFAAAYAYAATEEVWHGFVDKARHGNTYCHYARWGCSDIDFYRGSFRQFVHDAVRGRYNWINLAAYDRHASFEVRLHHASLDEKEVCNWIKANTRFTDWATTLGLAGVKEKLDGKDANEMFDIIVNEAWTDDDLRSYYAAKLVA